MARSQVRANQPHPRKPTHYKPLIDALDDRLVLDGWGLNLDFGTPDSPVDKAFIQFGTGAAGSKEGDFGWTNPARVEAYDTGLGSDLTRDGVRGIMNTFTAKVPNGKYEVSALLGNARSYNDRITVYSNQGIVVANLTDYRQRFVPVNFIAEVSDGNFRLTIMDAGGFTVTSHWHLCRFSNSRRGAGTSSAPVLATTRYGRKAKTSPSRARYKAGRPRMNCSGILAMAPRVRAA